MEFWAEVPAGRALAGFIAGDHACCTFGSDYSHDAIISRLARDSILHGERLLYLTDHSSEQAVMDRVAAAGIDAAAWRDSGRLQIESADTLYPPEGFDPERQIAAFAEAKHRARDDGYDGLAVAAEMSWMLADPDDWDAILEYEHRVTRIFDGRLRGLCLYDRRVFPEELMSCALAAHDFEIGVRPASLTARHWRMQITEQGVPAGIRLFGEVDYASGHYLTARLAEHTDGDGDVVVDACELSFIGANGCRALADAARLLTPPRRLLVTGVSRSVLRVFELCGFGDHPQLTLQPAD